MGGAQESTNPRGSEQQIAVGAATYGYHRMGSGPELVLLNGDAMCMSMWTDALLSRLADSFTVTIFDYPGMGRSTGTPDQSWLIPDMARQTLAFLGALGLDRPHVLGWSTGGEIALQMALFAPESLGKVISVAGDPGSTHYVGDPDVLSKLANATPQQMLAYLFPASATAAVSAFIADFSSRPQDEPSAEVMRAQEGAFSDWLAAGIWDELPHMTNPALIINGEQDALVDPQNARNMAERIPNAKLLLVPDAGHAVALQMPAWLAAQVKEFLH